MNYDEIIKFCELEAQISGLASEYAEKGQMEVAMKIHEACVILMNVEKLINNKK